MADDGEIALSDEDGHDEQSQPVGHELHEADTTQRRDNERGSHMKRELTKPLRSRAGFTSWSFIVAHHPGRVC